MAFFNVEIAFGCISDEFLYILKPILSQKNRSYFKFMNISIALLYFLTLHSKK
jgi:hypothetical protein